MIKLRHLGTLSQVNYGWLQSIYHFSFADFFDPAYTQFGVLRVLNDETLAPNSGFAAYPFSHMILIIYVYQGILTYQDNFKHQKRICAGECQIIHPGLALTLSHYNYEKTPTRFIQIWIQPNQKSLPLSYAYPSIYLKEKNIPIKHCLLATGMVSDDHPSHLHAKVRLSILNFEGNQNITYPLNHIQKAYLLILSGTIYIKQSMLSIHESAIISNEHTLNITTKIDSEILIIEMQ